MTTYNTYQEAKIANSERIIHKYDSGFTAESISEYGHSLQPCNPADYCMTVEKFLTDGHRFVEGDVFINSLGEVNILTSNETWVSNLNNSEASKLNGERYILRAAALEDKQESQHDMQESQGNSHQQLMETLNDACGIFGCIPSYLIKNIEGLMATNKEYAKALSGNASLEEKPRTKVEYVKCNNLQDSLDKFESMSGFEFYLDGDGSGDRINSVRRLALAYGNNSLYRRIETPMTERDELLEALQSVWVIDGVDSKEQLERIVDSGLVKLVN